MKNADVSTYTNPISFRLEKATINGLEVLYTYDASGFINGRYFYGSKKPRLPTTAELLKLVESQYLDHINRIEVINIIASILNILNIQDVQTIHSILTILNIDNIKSIGSIQTANINLNLIKNGYFGTGDFSGWNQAAGAPSISTDAPSTLTNYSAKLPNGSQVTQAVPHYAGKNFRVDLYLKTSVNNNTVIRYAYDDGSTEAFTLAGLTTWSSFSVVGTSAKRMSYFALESTGAAGVDVYYTAIRGYLVTDDLNGNQECLPKAKGHLAIVKRGQAVNTVTTIHMVTVGTTFYLDGGSMVAVVNGVLTGSARLEVDTGGNGVFRQLANAAMVGTVASDTQALTVPLVLAVPLGFPAGTVFRANSTVAGLTVDGCIQGWEE